MMRMMPMILRSRRSKDKSDHTVESVSAVLRKRIVESVQTASKNDAAAAVHVKFTSVRVKIMWKAKVKGQRPVISMCDCFHVDMKRAYRKNGACMFPKIGLRSDLRVHV